MTTRGTEMTQETPREADTEDVRSFGELAAESDSSLPLRRIAFSMLGKAHDQRNAAEWRLWAARDEVKRLRLLVLEAQAAEAIAQRDFDRAQEMLELVWADAKPTALREALGETER